MNTVELKKEKWELVEHARLLVDTAKVENRDLTPEEKAQVDGLLVKVEDLAGRIERLETIATEGVPAASGDRNSSNFYRDFRQKPRSFEGHFNKQGYSLMSAIRSFLNGGRLEGIEAEVNQELQVRMGKTPQRGFFVPFDMTCNESRALDTTTGAGGIATVTMPKYIDMLRNRLVADKLGVTWLPNLNGLIRIPRQTGTAATSWLAEGSNVTATNQTLDYVAMTPKTLAVGTVYTRKFLNESPINTEQFVRSDLIATTAREIDRVLLNGSGSGEEPRGILNVVGLTKVSSGTNGGALTWDNVVSLETTVLSANGVVDETACKYLTSPRAYKSSKTVSKGSSYPLFLYDEATKSLNSYPVLQSNVVPINLTKGSGTALTAMVFGDWSQAVLGSWGSGFEIVVDPYSQADSGNVRIYAMHDMDVAFRHVESFAAITDMS